MRITVGNNKLRALWSLLFFVGALWTFRTYGTQLPKLAADTALLATWVLLTSLFLIRPRPPSVNRLFYTHRIARSSMGASLLVALSSKVISQAGNVSVFAVVLLVVLNFSFFISSGAYFISKNSLTFPKLGNNRGAFPRYLDVFLPVGLGSVIIREVSIIMYAFWPGQRNADQIKRSSAVFSNHFVARPVLLALLCLATVELAVGHLLIRLLPGWVVAAHLIIGVFFIFYVVGLIRSFASLPTVIEDGILRMRMTVLFDAVTPISNVQAVSLVHSMPVDRDVANGAIIVAPNVLVELSRAIKVNRMFKPQSHAEAIALYVDNPAAFMTALAPLAPSEVNAPRLDLAV